MTKIKVEDFDLIIKGRQLSRGEALLENTSVEAEISHDQVDWFNSLEKELTQVQEDLSFYNNILGEFTAEDIVSLGLDSRSDTTNDTAQNFHEISKIGLNSFLLLKLFLKF